MELKFVHIQSGKEDWAQKSASLYEKKIGHHYPFQIITLKGRPLPREKKNIKIKNESELVLKMLDPKDWFILFDEQGTELKSSIDFSKKLSHFLQSGKKRIVFLIGGAFGVSEDVKERADMKISLTSLTMNHHIAMTMALEQIYRSICIEKKIPYHNE